MAYRIYSPNAQETYQIEQNRLNRQAQMRADDELAQIAEDHPDWTPDQVRMAQRGGIGGAPSNRLFNGFGLPARYQFSGDPSQEQPAPNGNPGFQVGGANSLANSLTRQQNAFRLGQITRAQSQLDKLDPEDSDNESKIAELKGRIGALTEESAASPSGTGQNQPTQQRAVPLGNGTAGEEAPVWRPGGPDAFKQLSNGGSVYFGSVAGAPPFKVGPQVTYPAPAIQDEPAAGTAGQSQAGAAPAAIAPQSNVGWSILKNALMSGMGGGSPAVATADAATDPNNITFPAPDATATPLNLSPGQIKKRIAMQAIEDNDKAPQYIRDAQAAKNAAFDAGRTNAPSGYTIGPSQPASDAAPGDPDGLPAAPVAAAPNTVSTQDDFDALPSGAVYIGQDGKKYKKP